MYIWNITYICFTDQLSEIVSQQFMNQSSIGKVVYNARYRTLQPQQLDNYIKDFVYLSHPCSSKHEHKVRI